MLAIFFTFNSLSSTGSCQSGTWFFRFSSKVLCHLTSSSEFKHLPWASRGYTMPWNGHWNQLKKERFQVICALVRIYMNFIYSFGCQPKKKTPILFIIAYKFLQLMCIQSYCLSITCVFGCEINKINTWKSHLDFVPAWTKYTAGQRNIAGAGSQFITAGELNDPSTKQGRTFRQGDTFTPVVQRRSRPKAVTFRGVPET